MKISGTNIVYLICLSIFYFALIFVLEKFHLPDFVKRLLVSKDAVEDKMPESTDEDVIEEAKRVSKSSPNDYMIRVNKLKKVFYVNKNLKKVAVNDLSFGI